MKPKFIVSACFLIFFAIPSHAQKSIDYGLSFGLNLTKIKAYGIKNTYDAGLDAGVFARLKLNSKWDFQPEILYDYTNSKKANNFIDVYNVNGNPNAATPIRLDYISLPLLMGYKVNKLLTINAGPQYSFLVYDDENLVYSNKAAAFKRNDLAIAAGAQLDLENVRFFTNYAYGILNINHVEHKYNWYTRQLVVGMNFNVL